MTFLVLKAILSSLASVSGRRIVNQVKTITARSIKATKMARQSATRRTAWPRAGATAATIMNIAITADIMRAIARPAYWSLSRATITERRPARAD